MLKFLFLLFYNVVFVICKGLAKYQWDFLNLENLVEGDEVLEINGISIMDKATSDIVKLLVKRMMVLTMVVIN